MYVTEARLWLQKHSEKLITKLKYSNMLIIAVMFHLLVVILVFLEIPFIVRKRIIKNKGETGLINSKSCLENPKLKTPQPIVDKILYLRKTYHFDQQRISLYLKRYHDISISSTGVYHAWIKSFAAKSKKVLNTHTQKIRETSFWSPCSG